MDEAFAYLGTTFGNRGLFLAIDKSYNLAINQFHQNLAIIFQSPSLASMIETGGILFVERVHLLH